MCIRDRIRAEAVLAGRSPVGSRPDLNTAVALYPLDLQAGYCLLYTSDAADERSSVDLGGRRIIKKKTQTDDYDVDYAQHTTNHNQIGKIRNKTI